MPSPISRRSLLLSGAALLAGCAVSPTMAEVPPSATPGPPDLRLKVMSYNILTGARTAAAFHRGVPQQAVTLAARAPVLARWITFADPDVAGLQENEPMEGPVRRPMEVLGPKLAGYQVLHAEATVPLLLRRGRFEVGEAGVELISDRYHLRYLSWAWLTDQQSGQRFLFANTHLDPGRSTQRAVARDQQLEAIVTRLGTLNPGWAAPQLLTGDLNIRSAETDPVQAEGLRRLERARLVNSERVAAQDLTAVAGAASVNSFGTEVDGKWRYGAVRHDGARLDYVWVGPPGAVSDWQVVTGPGIRSTDGAAWFADGPVPSDHCPVQATVTFPG